MFENKNTHRNVFFEKKKKHTHTQTKVCFLTHVCFCLLYLASSSSGTGKLFPMVCLGSRSATSAGLASGLARPSLTRTPGSSTLTAVTPRKPKVWPLRSWPGSRSSSSRGGPSPWGSVGWTTPPGASSSTPGASPSRRGPWWPRWTSPSGVWGTEVPLHDFFFKLLVQLLVPTFQRFFFFTASIFFFYSQKHCNVPILGTAFPSSSTPETLSWSASLYWGIQPSLLIK